MDPYSSPYKFPNNSLHNSFPHSLLRTRQMIQAPTIEPIIDHLKDPFKGTLGNYSGPYVFPSLSSSRSCKEPRAGAETAHAGTRCPGALSPKHKAAPEPKEFRGFRAYRVL